MSSSGECEEVVESGKSGKCLSDRVERRCGVSGIGADIAMEVCDV